MTNENGTKIAPAVTKDETQAQGIKARAIADKMQQRMAVHRRIKGGAYGLFVAGAVGLASACGGEAGPAYVEPTETPVGACPDLRNREVREGYNPIALNEALFTEGITVKMGGEEYLLKAVRLNDNSVEFILYKDGNPVANIVDQNGNPVSERLIVGGGETWTYVMEDGSRMPVTLCGFVTDAEGNRKALVVSDSFYWCTTVSDLESSEDFDSSYGLEVITKVQDGQTTDRGGAECDPLVTKKEIVELRENPIMPGVELYDGHLKTLGDEWDVVTLDVSGELMLGKSMASRPVDVGGTPLTFEDISVSATESRLYGTEWRGSVKVTYQGITVGVEDSATAGLLMPVEKDGVVIAFVRINGVGPGRMDVEIFVDTFKLVDGGSLVDAEGNVWSVELSKKGGDISNGVDGWVLTKM